MGKKTLPYTGPTPRRAHPDDAGMDLATPVQVIARAGGITTINTGFRTAIPQGHVGLVVPRSSLYRRGLHLAREEDLPTWGKWGAHRPEEVDKWKRLSRRLIC